MSIVCHFSHDHPGFIIVSALVIPSVTMIVFVGAVLVCGVGSEVDVTVIALWTQPQHSASLGQGAAVSGDASAGADVVFYVCLCEVFTQMLLATVTLAVVSDFSQAGH